MGIPLANSVWGQSTGLCGGNGVVTELGSCIIWSLVVDEGSSTAGLNPQLKCTHTVSYAEEDVSLYITLSLPSATLKNVSSCSNTSPDSRHVHRITRMAEFIKHTK